MWIINFIPEFVFHIITIVSVLVLILSVALAFIPFIENYKTLIQICATVTLMIGLYFEGALSNEDVWKNRVKELEVKSAQIEAKSANQNIKIVEKIVTKEKIIKEQQESIIQYVNTEVVKYNDDCKIPEAFINAHNKAAEIIK